MQRLITMSSTVSALDREFNEANKTPLSGISSRITPDIELSKQGLIAIAATQTSTHTKAVEAGVKLVTAYNWQYILQTIESKKNKKLLEDRL